MKYLLGILLLACVSCGNKEDVLLPKANRTVVKDVVDLSPIYIFFRVKGKDTLAEVNRKNSIGTTNWVLNIDRRLPLRLVIPEIIKLQEKKRGDSAHKNELAQNYYSYADTVGKNLAFVPFTNVFYKMGKPQSGIIVYFSKDGKIIMDNQMVSREYLIKYIGNFNGKLDEIHFGFDRNSSYGSYVQHKVFIERVIPKKALTVEFIY